MTQRWLISEEEDAALQGLTCEAQVMYLRIFRRYADFGTGEVRVTLGLLKQAIEYIPDPGSHEEPRRVMEISNHYVRARIAELERAGLVVRRPKARRFDPPVFRVPLAITGSVCPEKEPQRNRKGGTAKADAGGSVVTMQSAAEHGARGTAKEPQRGNRNIPGNRDLLQRTDVLCSRRQAADCEPQSVDNSPDECLGSRREAVPYQQIVALYHEVLPELPRVVKLTEVRRRHIRARWVGGDLPGLEDWREYFELVRQSRFLMGLGRPRQEGMRPFRADFDWLIREGNAVKVCEGRYCDQHRVPA